MKVAVVGAGVVGRLAARQLARRGIAVTLFDQGDFCARVACSFAAAGLLAPVAEAVQAADRSLFVLGAASRVLWTRMPEFPQSTRGTIALARPAEEAELREFRAKISRFLPAVPVRELAAVDVGRLEPALAGEDYLGIHVADEGHVDARAVMRLLAVELSESELVTLRLGRRVSRVAPYSVDEEAFDVVVDARGLGAKNDLGSLRGVRGELVELRAPEVRLTRPLRVLHQRHPVYVVPRGEDRFAVGATVIESESSAPPSVKAVLDLLGAVHALHPGFRYAEVTELVAGVRPVFDDHRPRLHVTPGLVRVNGLYRHGFLLSPLFVEVIMRLIVNGIETEATAEANLAALLDELGYAQEGIAVALNKDFVPRRSFGETRVKDGDRIEVLAPMAGG